ncbi:MAG: hypothetical protein Q8939_08825, partial [Bacteroidota bacterium]|nr:hypothetical protein [Bacteroidota bacterium]
YAKYDWRNPSWAGGFGQQVLGETWVSHHGDHGKESTRGVINEAFKEHPVLRGVGDIWGPTDVYTVGRLKDASILIYGQSTSGMVSTAPVNLQKSIMPVAWTRTYRIPGGKEGKAFATTMGAAIDFLNEDLRRLLVNACFWAVGMEKQIPEKADVDFVSEYNPTMFGLELFRKGCLPSKYEMK